MSHFLRDDAKAKTNLEQAAKLKYAEAKLGEEQNNNYDNYLSELIKEYLEAVLYGRASFFYGAHSVGDAGCRPDYAPVSANGY